MLPSDEEYILQSAWSTFGSLREPTESADVGPRRPETKAAVAEFIAMTLFVIVGCGTACGYGASDGETRLVVAFAFGMSILVLVYAICHLSGGHINGAATDGKCHVVRSCLREARGTHLAARLGSATSPPRRHSGIAEVGKPWCAASRPQARRGVHISLSRKHTSRRIGCVLEGALAAHGASCGAGGARCRLAATGEELGPSG